MTIYEKLKSMSKDELAEFLSSIDCLEDQPYRNWFNEQYCNKCEPVIARYTDSNHDMQFAPCELGECPFGVSIQNLSDKDMVMMWLNSET